ncbi:MAG: FAD-binding oxidoreductase [Bauldia sp.]|nr:FAD-binding oxidoreductase [Bauldia sp.]
MPAPPPDLIDRFAAIVGRDHALTDQAAIAPYLVEWRGLFHGATPLVLCPGSTAEVSAILRLANDTRTAIVPQGGNTGLVGGQIPDASGAEIVLSLSRLARVRDIDPTGNTMTVEAGLTLRAAQEAAAGVDRLFPLSLASEERCQIGGVLSTNAGGVAVLAYGNARDLVLGLEVVLASGEVWSGLRRLRKDNTGYSLRNLFVGAEGTLGIITAASLRLYPRPRGRSLAFFGVATPDAALAILNLALEEAGSQLTSFELMSEAAMAMTLAHVRGAALPLARPYPWYVLAEISSGQSADAARALLDRVATRAQRERLSAEIVSAADPAEAESFWRLRLALSEVQKEEGASIKHDVSVPIARLPEFLRRADAAVRALVPGCRPVPFGHVGDGNMHFNVSRPETMEDAAFLARWRDMNEAVHAIASELGGSIAAEHGIGQLKRDLLPAIKDPVELAAMRAIKRTLDPNGILNPGKVL